MHSRPTESPILCLTMFISGVFVVLLYVVTSVVFSASRFIVTAILDTFSKRS